ncbi:hypothetical protein Ancab_021207 [Ancistrocladus abbreviatus]
MGDMTDKVKDFAKKVNNPFSSLGKFKGQGRVSGSSASSPTNPILARPAYLANSASNSNPRFISSRKRNKNEHSLSVFECPVCNGAFSMEEEMLIHIESCMSNLSENRGNSVVFGLEDKNENCTKVANELETCVSAYLFEKPAKGLIGVVLRLLRNIVK